MPDPMTTPQSLTEEDLRLLERLPSSPGRMKVRFGDVAGLSLLGFARCDVPFEVKGSDDLVIASRDKAGEVLLATLQAERERVNGALSKLIDVDSTVCVTLFGTEEDGPYGYAAYPATDCPADPDYRDTPLEALEFAASVKTDPENHPPSVKSAASTLSPDVLGDQKDKGKATGKGSLTAPEASEELPSSEGSRVAVLTGDLRHEEFGDFINAESFDFQAQHPDVRNLPGGRVQITIEGIEND